MLLVNEQQATDPFFQATFPKSEYEARIFSLKKAMNMQNIDVCLISDPANIYYLCGHQTTGYGTLQGLIVSLTDEPFLLMRHLEASNSITRTYLKRPLSYSDVEDPIQILVKNLKNQLKPNKTFALETQGHFPSSLAKEHIIESLQDHEIKSASGLVESLRVVKSPLEIEIMKKAAKATQEAMAAGLDCIQPNITENVIAAHVHSAMYKAGGEYPAVAPYITSGPRTTIGHATWEGRHIKEGDCIFIELAGCYRRYHTAMMRTTFLGNAPNEMLIAQERVINALSQAIDEMKPGVSIPHIDAVCRKACRLDDIGATQITRMGYSIGIAFAPSWDEGHLFSIKSNENLDLKENMTIHLIPWMQLPKLNMVMGISETVLVTSEGAQSFFDFPQKFIK